MMRHVLSALFCIVCMPGLSFASAVPEALADAWRTALAAQGDAYRASRDALVSRGDAALPFLREKARSASWQERIVAEACLGWIEHPEAYADLRAVLDGKKAKADDKWLLRKPGWEQLRAPPRYTLADYLKRRYFLGLILEGLFKAPPARTSDQAWLVIAWSAMYTPDFSGKVPKLRRFPPKEVVPYIEAALWLFKDRPLEVQKQTVHLLAMLCTQSGQGKAADRALQLFVETARDRSAEFDLRWRCVSSVGYLAAFWRKPDLVLKLLELGRQVGSNELKRVILSSAVVGVNRQLTPELAHAVLDFAEVVMALPNANRLGPSYKDSVTGGSRIVPTAARCLTRLMSEVPIPVSPEKARFLNDVYARVRSMLDQQLQASKDPSVRRFLQDRLRRAEGIYKTRVEQAEMRRRHRQ